MPQIVVLVGTRKGCFVLESDGDRRDWKLRGPYCEEWPIYDAVVDPAAGALYAAAASEWHGVGVWRSPDLGETWELSSEGLNYGDPDDNGGLKLSRLAGLTATHGRLLAGGESAGLFESRDGGATWSLKSTLDGQPGRGDWNDPDKQPPGHLGLPGLLTHPDDPARYWVVVQGYGTSRRRTTARRGRRATAGCAPTGRASTRRSASACTSSSCRRPTTTGSTSRTTAGCTAATTPGSRGRRSPTACRPTSASPPQRTRTIATAST